MRSLTRSINNCTIFYSSNTEDGKKVFVSEVRVEKLEEGELRREGSGKSTIYVRLK